MSKLRGIVGKRYALYGLQVDSELELTPVLTRCVAEPAGQPDVRIVLEPVSADGLEGGQQVGAFCQAQPGALWLHVPGVAHFLVEDGSLIRVMPSAGAPRQTVLLYLLGNVLGALLHQRGYLVLHGNVLSRGGKAFVVCGASGSGKSTLSAALIRHAGYSMVSDDLCVLDPQGWAQPGYPELKLWRDAAEALLLPEAELEPLREQIEKFGWNVDQHFYAEPVQLSGVYLLSSDNRAQEPLFEPVKGMAKLTPFKAQVYRPQVIPPLGLSKANFMLVGRLLGKLDLVRVERSLDKLDAGALERFALAVAGNAATLEQAV